MNGYLLGIVPADSRDSDQSISVDKKGIKVGIKDVIHALVLSSSPR